jgi:hypothetical protein
MATPTPAEEPSIVLSAALAEKITKQSIFAGREVPLEVMDFRWQVSESGQS